LLPTAAKAFGTAASVVASQRSEKGERSLNLGLAPNTIFKLLLKRMSRHHKIQSNGHESPILIRASPG
jgi:hypothetical protein